MSAEFDAVVNPFKSDLMSLLDIGRAMRESNSSMPAASSPAMAELADEARLSGDWGRRPVESAHNWGGLLLVGAEDQLRTMCRIVVGEPSLFGPQTLTRSGLEMAGRAYWSFEPGIGAERRVARYQTDRLFNASETRRLTGDAATATNIEKPVLETAKALGLTLLRGKKYKHTHIIDERPSGNAVFKGLLGGADQRGLGHMMFSYLSAVDHGTAYALMQVVERVDTTPLGRPLGALRMSSKDVIPLLGIAAFGYAECIDRRNRLFGWDSTEWRQVSHEVIRHFYDAFRDLAA